MLHYPISQRTRFSRNVIEQGFDPGAEVLFERIEPAGPEVAEKLAIPETQSVVHRRGIGKIDNIPIELADVYLPLDRFPDFPRVKARHRTYTGAVAAYGIKDYVRLSTLIESRMPTPEEAWLLDQPVLAPVFVVTRIDADLDRRPILFGRALWSSTRVAFEIADPVG